MPILDRRTALNQLTATMSVGLFGLFSEPSYGSSNEDIFRTASLTLAKACLKSGDYKDFTQWLYSAQVIPNPLLDAGNAFHNQFSFPVLFTTIFDMRRTKDRGGYFGVKGLPQLNYTEHFNPEIDLNAAEIATVSDAYMKDGNLAMAASSRQLVRARDRDDFFFALGRKTNLRPADIDNLYYAREFRLAGSSQSTPGFGFSIAGQAGIGRFLLA